MTYTSGSTGALDPRGDQAIYLRRQALAAQKSGDLGRAVELLHKAGETADAVQAGRARVSLARVWVDCGRPEQADLSLARALDKASPASAPDIYLDAAALWHVLGRTEAAGTAYRAVLNHAHRPTDRALAAFRLGHLGEEAGEYEEALALWQRSLVEADDQLRPFALLEVAGVLARLSREDEAIELYYQLVGSDHPDLSPRGGLLLARLLAERCQWSETLELLQLIIDSGHPEYGTEARSWRAELEREMLAGTLELIAQPADPMGLNAPRSRRSGQDERRTFGEAIKGLMQWIAMRRPSPGSLGEVWPTNLVIRFADDSEDAYWMQTSGYDRSSGEPGSVSFVCGDPPWALEELAGEQWMNALYHQCHREVEPSTPDPSSSPPRRLLDRVRRLLHHRHHMTPRVPLDLDWKDERCLSTWAWIGGCETETTRVEQGVTAPSWNLDRGFLIEVQVAPEPDLDGLAGPASINLPLVARSAPRPSLLACHGAALAASVRTASMYEAMQVAGHPLTELPDDEPGIREWRSWHEVSGLSCTRAET
jgi:tetratricopeptide (TPR) repeat protein